MEEKSWIATVRIGNDRREDKENTGKNLQTNEDAWENLDTSEWRDHELIREYLNDAPVRLEDDNWKLRKEKKPEMMDSGYSNWEDSWIAPDGWKEISQPKPIMRGW